MDPEDQTFLPKIPAQPIGYFDAKVILENMGGSPVPNEWNGGIENITYNLGGSMKNGFKITWWNYLRSFLVADGRNRSNVKKNLKIFLNKS